LPAAAYQRLVVVPASSSGQSGHTTVAATRTLQLVIHYSATMSSVVSRKKLIKQLLREGVRELSLEMLNQLHHKQRRWWVRPWIQRREELGASSRLLQELKEEDPETYRNVLRMTAPQFQELLELVEPLIKKQDTVFRQAIPCKTKLEITLRYLATGDSFRSLALLFRVPHNSISVFLPEVLSAIYEVLQPFIKVSNIIQTYF